MDGWLNTFFQRLLELPSGVLYAFLSVTAAIENVFPPIPADMIALLGGFLAARGSSSVSAVFFFVWIGNVAGALLVYGIGWRFGARFFSGRWGRVLLRPRQMERLGVVYRSYGPQIIFVSRFLPMFRAVVPVFAGVNRLGFFRTALPIAAASGLWYAAIVYLGAAAGHNWLRILAGVQAAGQWLLGLALLGAAGVFRWWWRTRDEGS